MGIGKKEGSQHKIETGKTTIEKAVNTGISNFQKLYHEIKRGMSGKNKGIPMGFKRLNRYIGIRKSMYYLIGGLTGSGKTSFIDDAFVLNPFDWYYENAIVNQNTNIKLKIIYRSMERNRTYKLAKWLARKIFIDTGVEINVSKLLGWTFESLTEDELALVKKYENYMDAMEQVIEIIDGAENPVGIAKDLKTYAEENGKFEKIPYGQKYTPNDENLITLVIIDHIGLLRPTKTFPTKKQAIDKMSDECRYYRDTCGFSFVAVSQFNRSIANPMRIKAGDVEPQLEDFKESSSTQDDADIVLALFDPIRYKVDDPSGYDLDELRDDYGAKYFRSLRLIKNSYGEDDIRVGLAFMGSIGYFKELPRQRDMTDQDYKDIRDKVYFLN
jgi:hypothetical protein